MGMEAKTFLAEACVDVAYHLGGINEALTNETIEHKDLTDNRFRNFLKEMHEEAKSGKIAALAINLVVLQGYLQRLSNKDSVKQSEELSRAIGESIWKCERAIDILYKYDNTGTSFFYEFGRPVDD